MVRIDPVKKVLGRRKMYCPEHDVPMKYLGIKKHYGEKLHAYNCPVCAGYSGKSRDVANQWDDIDD